MANRILVHPDTGGKSFGSVPKMNSRGTVIPAGEVRLLSGKHVGPNRGFGAAHIWAEHAAEMEQAGFHTQAGVPAYVASIVRAGTPIFFAGDSMRRTRVTVVRSASGTAVLEFRDQRHGPIWSGVTAFSGTKTHGTRVGTVR